MRSKVGTSNENENDVNRQTIQNLHRSNLFAANSILLRPTPQQQTHTQQHACIIMHHHHTKPQKWSIFLGTETRPCRRNDGMRTH